ncbi:AAA family ATPase [Desulfobacterota bacterium AH_259_B03_O07]|nr:AAA family ATPase [Desulfobacterota bacterium AH_259_B03_O07]
MRREERVYYVKDFIQNVPLYSPKKVFEELEKLGYRGQARARRAISLAAYRHVKRLQLLHNKRVPRSELPPRPNTILMGPTGCGKTYLIELLFGEIFKLPFVIIDMTKFTESGYVGDDVVNILVQLVYAANESIDIGECGIVVLDEFDKIAGAYSNARFAGQGTTKDVSGYGVQRELLKILEGTDIQIPLDFGFSSRGPRALISTRDISFFAVGAFSGIRSLFEKGGLGFLQKVEENLDGEAIAYKLTEEEADDVSRFHLFGFLPELIARYNRIVPFAPLDNDTLKEIFFLKVEKYIREFQEEGFRLHLEPRVADFIITEAIRRQTGARGLDVLISKHLEEVAFEIFGKGDEGEVILRVASDKVSHTIKRRA